MQPCVDWKIADFQGSVYLIDQQIDQQRSEEKLWSENWHTCYSSVSFGLLHSQAKITLTLPLHFDGFFDLFPFCFDLFFFLSLGAVHKIAKL